MKKLVIMPGGFHPFHAGHLALYTAAQEAFPSADVFVAATADTSSRPFPFKLKKTLARAAGVPTNRFIQVKSPFRAEEITQMYDPKDTQLIFVRSEKDRDTQPRAGGRKKDGSPSYLQPYKRTGRESFDKHAYMAYLPVAAFGPGMTSATEIRAKWPDMEGEQKIGLIKSLYPITAGNDAAAAKIAAMFDETIGKPVEESLGKALTTAALAGSMFMGQPADAQSIPDGNTQATVVIQGQQKIFDMGKMDVRKAAEMLEKSLSDKGITNFKISVTDGRQRANIDTIGARVDRTNEAVLINDPDAGHLLVPDGGMGTWSEDSLRSNLARKFASMVDMVKSRQYNSLYHVLYDAGVVQSMIQALQQYDRFMTKQGRRPIARGREIDLSQVSESPDYIDEAEPVEITR